MTDLPKDRCTEAPSFTHCGVDLFGPFVIILNKVEQCCDETSIKFDMNEIDRVHYIGKPVFDTDSKQRVRSIIVTFKSWELRKTFYKTRGRNFINGRKKPGAKSFSVS